MKRRDFVKQGGLVGAGLCLGAHAETAQSMSSFPILDFKGKNANESARDESLWKPIQQAFQPSPDFINLENGYFSPQPLSTLKQQEQEISALNTSSSFYMRREQTEALQNVKAELAALAGCKATELVITRNTTESLDTVIHGYPWQAGDEVVLSRQDYGSMIAAFEQQARRSGIKLRYVKIPLHPKDDGEILKVYEQAITPKTRMVLFTQLINLSGQVLPVQKLCAMARKKGVESMVDAAHSFAHISFKISDINCDYFGTSLHKWLCAPLGLGLLWMKPEHVQKIWPLFGDNEYAEDDVRKLEHHGTRPWSAVNTIPAAIAFHQSIGAERKEERLKYLQHYWTDQVREMKHLEILTPAQPERSGALANVASKKLSPNELAAYLFDEHRIFTVAINSPEVNGVRITPHLYTRLEELDKLVAALKRLA